jgi:nucleotide-binding universal stress UspA family protein
MEPAMFKHILIPTDGSPLSTDALAKAARFPKDAGAKVTVINVTEPFLTFTLNPEQIEGCDLIAMASHGRRGVSAVVLGSETLKVLTHSKTPVLVHR